MSIDWLPTLVTTPVIEAEAPEVPEVPAVPAGPAVPDVPAGPVIPDVPDVPFLPEVPEVPAVPEIPLVPDVPVARVNVPTILLVSIPITEIGVIGLPTNLVNLALLSK